MRQMQPIIIQSAGGTAYYWETKAIFGRDVLHEVKSRHNRSLPSFLEQGPDNPTKTIRETKGSERCTATNELAATPIRRRGKKEGDSGVSAEVCGRINTLQRLYLLPGKFRRDSILRTSVWLGGLKAEQGVILPAEILFCAWADIRHLCLTSVTYVVHFLQSLRNVIFPAKRNSR